LHRCIVRLNHTDQPITTVLLFGLNRLARVDYNTLHTPRAVAVGYGYRHGPTNEPTSKKGDLCTSTAPAPVVIIPRHLCSVQRRLAVACAAHGPRIRLCKPLHTPPPSPGPVRVGYVHRRLANAAPGADTSTTGIGTSVLFPLLRSPLTLARAAPSSKRHYDNGALLEQHTARAKAQGALPQRLRTHPYPACLCSNCPSQPKKDIKVQWEKQTTMDWTGPSTTAVDLGPPQAARETTLAPAPWI